MNRFVRLVKENVIPSIIFSVLAVSCCSAWYFLHPASPYHERFSFVVSYQAIGTLSPGNKVEVRGISVGQITKVELTDDAVFVTAEVLATTKIPDNSEYRLINSGLMGEREMCILTGDSPNLIHAGDTVFGHYDEGTSGVSKSLAEALRDAGEIKDTLVAFVDSLKDGSTGKQIQRVLKKGKNLVWTANSDIKDWTSQVEQILGGLDGALNNMKATLNDVADKGVVKLDQVEELLGRVNPLLQKVAELKDRSAALLDPLAKDDNTAGLIMAENGQFKKDIEKLTLDVEALVSDIKKSGVKFNIDIF